MIPIIIMMAIESEEDYTFIEKLYMNYEKHMYFVAFSILHNQHDSEDCVHDAVLSIMNCLDTFKHIDEERKLRRLVAIAVKNKAIDLYRRKKRQLEVESSMVMEIDGDLVELDVADTEADVLQLVINEETRRLVASLVRSLDDIYRDVIVLKFEQEMTTKEIARFLGISEELVRMRYLRAKRLLIEKGGKALYEASRR